jgi:histidyl-tRNA synthetase
MGLERVLLALADEGVAPPSEPPLAAYVVAIGGAARSAAQELVAELRTAGIGADLGYEDRPLKAQLKMADRADATVAVIIGEQELAAGSVTLRRMDDGTQTAVALAEVASHLRAGEGSA